MNDAAFLKRLNRIYAAEDYFPGVLGNPNRVAPRPKPAKVAGSKTIKQKSAMKSRRGAQHA